MTSGKQPFVSNVRSHVMQRHHSPDFEDADSLFSLATEYLEAADILVHAPLVKINISLVSFYLLGHAAELLLKSFLYKRGVPLKDLREKFGHDLADLVRQARECGLATSISLTHLETFSECYKSKRTEYRLIKTQTFPAQDLLLDELRCLERVVFNNIAEVGNPA